MELICFCIINLENIPHFLFCVTTICFVRDYFFNGNLKIFIITNSRNLDLSSDFYHSDINCNTIVISITICITCIYNIIFIIIVTILLIIVIAYIVNTYFITINMTTIEIAIDIIITILFVNFENRKI